MANANSKPPWRALAARASVHLGTARLLLDLILDESPPEPLAGKLRSIEGEVHSAEDLVREIVTAGAP
jgi:hypothetical protein